MTCRADAALSDVVVMVRLVAGSRQKRSVYPKHEALDVRETDLNRQHPLQSNQRPFSCFLVDFNDVDRSSRS